MQILAYPQKLAKAGRALDEEIAKATKSVMEVTVILAPARAKPRAHRSVKASSSSCLRGTVRSRSKALTITNLQLQEGIGIGEHQNQYIQNHQHHK